MIMQPTKSGTARSPEALLVMLVFAVALAARGLFLWQAGIDQYDEGVYAFSGLGLFDDSQPHRIYPGQVRFSPPAYFTLVGLGFAALGASDSLAILINVLLGAFTVLAVWWAGRRWFGPAAGVAAAVMLALNEAHITLSRSALTDVAFGLFFVLALVALVETVRKESFSLAILAGLAVGVAWNTKYHGWFAPLITGGALLAWSYQRRREEPLRIRPFVALGISAVVALLCYLPWMLFIRSQPGSMEGLANYYMTMLSPEWFANFWRHVRMQYFLEGPYSRVGVMIAIGAIVLLAKGTISTTTRLWQLALLTASVLLIGAAGVTLLLAVVFIASSVRSRASLPVWLLAAWIGLWLVAAPIYHPYFRLLLPLTIATCLGAGAQLARWVSMPESKAAVSGRSLVYIGAAAAIVFLVSLGLPDPSNPWRPSRSAAVAATTIASHVPRGNAVLVVGEPPIAFYLHMAARPSFGGVERKSVLDTLRQPVYIVTGRYSKQVPGIRKWMAQHEPQLQHLASVPFFPRDLRLLDDFDPKDARRLAATRDSTFDLDLYLYRPASEGNSRASDKAAR